MNAGTNEKNMNDRMPEYHIPKQALAYVPKERRIKAISL